MTNQTLWDLTVPTESNNDCFSSEDVKPEDIKELVTDTDIDQMQISNSVENEGNTNIQDAPVNNYFKPFEKGWKRELVMRAVSQEKVNAMYDVYYISPCGKKLRSKREIESFLTDSKLSFDDFTFQKILLGINNPNMETFRLAQAKRKRTYKIVENEDEIKKNNQVEVFENSTCMTENVTITASGRQGRLPKHLRDYKVSEICHRAPKSKTRTDSIINNDLMFSDNIIYRLNNEEPSTSKSSGGNLYVDVVKEHFDIFLAGNLDDLRKIEIFSSIQSGFKLNSDLTPLSSLTSLASLKLTPVKNLNLLNIEIFASLTNLEELCLGYCDNFSSTFATDVLTCLNKLKILRMEGGQNVCVLNILSAVAQMPSLQQLELLMFNIPQEFGRALAECKHITRLLVIPIYEFKAHYIIYWILKALFDWQQLEYFVLVITEDLIKVTKEFNAMHGLNIEACVPILEPISTLYVNNISSQSLKAKSPLRRSFTPNPHRVEFITVSRLQFLFSKILSNAQARIVTVPDSEIWKSHL